MSDEVPLQSCRLPGCGGPPSGVCINNFAFDECPDVIQQPGTDEKADAAIATSPSTVQLPGGRNLDLADSDALLRHRGGEVVALVAGPDVGKTTLIATMYELLHRRRMTAFRFAGSETLRSYEERCHLARMASNASKPNTNRTPISAKANFTHLRVGSADRIRDVLFCDRSGEHFENALSRPAEFANFEELHRANTVVLLIDLVRLVSENQVTVSRLRRLFMAMDQNGLLDEKKLLLVGTKADIAMPTTRSRKAEQLLKAVDEELNRRAGGRFQVKYMIVASRARKGSTQAGEGLERLLEEALHPAAKHTPITDETWPADPTELDKLMRIYRGVGG